MLHDWGLVYQIPKIVKKIYSSILPYLALLDSKVNKK